jgi:hypothetical protein
MRRLNHPWYAAALIAAFLTPHTTASPVALGSAHLFQDAEEVEPEAEETVESILDEYDEAMDAYRTAARAAETDEERAKASEAYPRPNDYAGRLIAVAKRAPKAEEALEALTWVFQRGAAGDQKPECYELVLTHHIDNEEAGAFCMNLSRDAAPDVEKFLETMIKKSTDHTVRGSATYALAGVLGTRASVGNTLRTADEKTVEAYRGYYSSETVDLALSSDAAALSAQREKLLITAAETYGDIKLRGRTLGEAATGDLFEVRNLQVGKVAPDILGDDLDGVEFKLSDYRGKVVFLDFWGDW